MQSHSLFVDTTESRIMIRKPQDKKDADMMAIMTTDRNRHYYLATRGSTEPSLVSRDRWQQGEDKEADATLEKIEFYRPHVVSQFHRVAGKIDMHNRIRHDILRLSSTWKTKRWDIRVNMTTLGINFVDSYLVYTKATCQEDTKGREFFATLATQLIENMWDVSPVLGRSRRPRQAAVDEEDFPDKDNFASSGLGLHLTPVKEKAERGFTAQHRCSGKCGKKVTRECNLCRDSWLSNQKYKRQFLCAPKAGNQCWKLHCREVHCVEL